MSNTQENAIRMQRFQLVAAFCRLFKRRGGSSLILKRVLSHVCGFNLTLVMRLLLGKGTPRGLQGLSADALLILSRFWIAVLVRTEQNAASVPAPVPSHAVHIVILIPLTEG